MDKGIHSSGHDEDIQNDQDGMNQSKPVKPIEYTEIYAWGGKLTLVKYAKRYYLI